MKWRFKSSAARDAKSTASCGYCHGDVPIRRARVATVRNQTMYVHRWHPAKRGEGWGRR